MHFALNIFRYLSDVIQLSSTSIFKSRKYFARPFDYWALDADSLTSGQLITTSLLGILRLWKMCQLMNWKTVEAVTALR
uniref:Uncharacterized protein n=1 Tax=Parascaris equorum TaxID=6256 RepID=A0A914RNS8_PAREQ